MISINAGISLLRDDDMVSVFDYTEAFESIKFATLEVFKTELIKHLVNYADKSASEVGIWINIEESMEIGLIQIFYYGGCNISIDESFAKATTFLKKHRKEQDG